MRKFSLGLLLALPLALALFAPGFAAQKAEIGMGNNNAPIIMDVYSDFQCPHCKHFHDELQPQIVRDYVNTGKVYLIHHDFPLPTFKYSREAALYAIAAARFNKYEAVADALFARQDYWGQNGKVDEVVATVLTPEEMKKARVLIKDPQVIAHLDHEIEMGKAAKVNSTPSIFITRHLRVIPVPANTSYPILSKVLDDLLTK
jgi:protein-disulfide isomerase